MAYIGSKDRLNSVVGVSEIIPLTTGLETEYGNKIFKANLIFKKESTGLLYISDGVTTLAALPAITDNVSTIINQHISNNNIHLTPEAATTVTNAINNLDVSDITGFGAGKTLSALSEANGKISASF